MAVRLTAKSGQLPLIWETDSSLGDRRSFTDESGEQISGQKLAQRLAGEGSGIIPITLSGQLSVLGEKDRPLHPWETTREVFGPLDTNGLISVAFALAREVSAPYGKGNTPPEFYLTSITVGEPEPEPEPEEPEDEGPIIVGYRIRYRDTQTGHYVTRDTWLRSRRAIRARAKSLGVRPWRGRYIRVRIPIYG